MLVESLIEVSTVRHLVGYLLVGVVLFKAIQSVINFYRYICSVNKIPGPAAGWPFVLGNLPIINANKNVDMLSSFFQAVCGLTQIYAKQMFRVWLSHKPIVVVHHAEATEAVLASTVHIEKAVEYRFLYPWLGTGLLTSGGKKWFTRRKMITPAFHFNILEAFLPTMNEQSNILVDKICQRMKDHHSELESSNSKNPGTALDIVPLITHCALDVICETAMGVSIGSQNHKNMDYVQANYRVGGNVIKRIISPWFWPALIYRYFSANGRSDHVDLKVLHDFTMKVIKERKQETLSRIAAGLESRPTVDRNDNIDQQMTSSRKRRLAFLDILIEQHLKDPKGFPDSDIRDEVDTFMFEGHDTTSMSLIWTLYLIGEHPDIQQRLYDELNDTLEPIDPNDPNSVNISTEKLRQLKFLEACIKESLRLFPSVPFIGRTAANDFTYEGNVIPKGTTILLLLFMIQRDPTHFAKPDHFIPDRFMEETREKLSNPFAYVPFSAGPRNCIGQKFALQEEKIILAKVLRNFRVESVHNLDRLVYLPELVIRPKEPIMVRFFHRD